jgi:hypothetical protein
MRLAIFPGYGTVIPRRGMAEQAVEPEAKGTTGLLEPMGIEKRAMRRWLRVRSHATESALQF